MSAVLRVALLGFNNIERAAIKAAFAQAALRRPGYALVADLETSDLVLADAEHMAAVRLVLATERLADTVFVGQSQAMAVTGAAAWLSRPIAAAHLLREFDALLAQRGGRGGVQPPTLHTQRPSAARRTSERAPMALMVDSETAPYGMAHRLQQWGFSVEHAAHSGQALALLSRRDFDSVFIDVNLGPASALNGFALCQQLKRHPPHGLRRPLWVALVTALNSPSDRVRGTLAGCDAYLTKPVDGDELARVLWVQGWAPPPPRLQPAPP